MGQAVEFLPGPVYTTFAPSIILYCTYKGTYRILIFGPLGGTACQVTQPSVQPFGGGGGGGGGGGDRPKKAHARGPPGSVVTHHLPRQIARSFPDPHASPFCLRPWLHLAWMSFVYRDARRG
jgi:hypothetical protein